MKIILPKPPIGKRTSDGRLRVNQVGHDVAGKASDSKATQFKMISAIHERAGRE